MAYQPYYTPNTADPFNPPIIRFHYDPYFTPTEYPDSCIYVGVCASYGKRCRRCRHNAANLKIDHYEPAEGSKPIDVR